MNKQQLRKLYIEKRASLSEDDYRALNEQILQQFKSLDLGGVSYLHIFLPILSRKEPDTRLIVNWTKAEYPGIKIVYPKTDFNDLTISSFLDDAALELSENDYGITEPIRGNEVGIDKIDLVVVPLLTVDERGYRVGYGKGFYDRFMAKCRPGTRFVGLSHFDPIDRIDDIDAYDIPLHQCITPGKILKFCSVN